MLANTLEHVDKVVAGIDVMHTAGRDQTLDDLNMLGTKRCPTKNPILYSHGADRRCRAGYTLRIATFDNLAHVSQDDVATWALRQA